MEELYIDETIKELLGTPMHALPKHRYAEAVAAALIIRHSWQGADLACIIARLGLKGLPNVPVLEPLATEEARRAAATLSEHRVVLSATASL
jgi:hypothetical protein